MLGVILAAGKGSRISNVTRGVPKSFLEINGFSIIDRQIKAMKDNEINKIIIVVGYRMDLFIDKFQNDRDIILVKNPFYADCNVLGSLWMARPYLGKGFIFTHADTFFDPTIIKDLLEHKGEVVLATELKNNCQAEEMKVKVENMKIVKVSKELDCKVSDGEFTGVAKIDQNMSSQVIDFIDHRVENHGGIHDYFEAVFQDMIDEGVVIHSMDIGKKYSIEIDFPSDYAAAKEIAGGS